MKKLYSFITTLFISAFLCAQVPNGGFENWTDMGTYMGPDNWSTLNTMTSELGVYTCTQGTPGSPGNSYMKITSRNTTQMGVIPGVAVCGELDAMTQQPVSGFPYTERPTSFDGKWQHMIFGDSQGFIDVTLTKWNSMTQSRDVVGNAHTTLVGMAMSWANFSIDFTYNSDSNPDSCIIFVSASGNAPANNDYLWLDNLTFQGQLAGIESNTSNSPVIEIFPNPAIDFTQILVQCNSPQSISIQITGMNGELIAEMQPTSLMAKCNYRLETQALAKGVYLITIKTGSGIENRKLIIQ